MEQNSLNLNAIKIGEMNKKKIGKTLEFCPQSCIVVRFRLILFAACGPML